MTSKSKLTGVLLLLAFLCTYFVFTAFAAEKGSAAEEGSLWAEKGIVGIANRGMWHSEPENSLEALLSATKTGIDGVLADVSLTKDGVPVVIEAASAKRMLEGAQVNEVNSFTLEELSGMLLKEGSGGKNNKVSSRRVATLKQVIEELEKTEALLVLKTDVSNFEAIKILVENKKNVVIYLTGNEKQVKNLLSQNGNSFNIITEKKGNVVFVQTSFIDFTAENGGVGTVLKTKNRYGVNFNQTVLKHFSESFLCAADLTQPETAGARQDTEKWWDDLISRGYSLIITNDAQGFADYKKSNEESRARLEGVLKKYTEEWKLPEFKSLIFNDFRKAYTDALNEANRLLGDKSSSGTELDDCYSALVKACDDIDLNYEALEQGKAGMTVSPVRILLCVAFALAVVAVQVFFYKRRKKA